MSTKPWSLAKSSARIALAEFVRDPAKVGSAFPATERLVDRVFEPLNWPRIGVLVEFGPGTGRFTSAALARMRRGTRLIAIEPGGEFVDHLQSSIRDPRLSVVRGLAQDVAKILSDHGLSQVDCIVSGLPFSTLNHAVGAQIAEASASVLSQHGSFAAYQMRTSVKPLLRRYFYSVRSRYEWRNIPPCHLYWASHPRFRPHMHSLVGGRAHNASLSEE
ncbi:class I SAM-dependent methyltransferase [Novosphingobium sp. KA1]|uniref:class I SAM-dependent methyltransferase n=1 Tax=Novosphingobium sp. (strain KA1) TaxID=164608 RepID=UPI001A90BD9D|nr:methyltransferase [Novosphingobium sp. KA1]